MASPHTPITPVLWAAISDRQGPHADALVASLADALDAAVWAYLHGVTTNVPDVVGTVLEFTLDMAHADGHAWNLELDGCTPTYMKPRVIQARKWPHPDPLIEAIRSEVTGVVARTLAAHPWMSRTTLCVRLGIDALTAHQRLGLEAARAAVIARTTDLAIAA